MAPQLIQRTTRPQLGPVDRGRKLTVTVGPPSTSATVQHSANSPGRFYGGIVSVAKRPSRRLPVAAARFRAHPFTDLHCQVPFIVDVVTHFASHRGVSSLSPYRADSQSRSIPAGVVLSRSRWYTAADVVGDLLEGRSPTQGTPTVTSTVPKNGWARGGPRSSNNPSWRPGSSDHRSAY